MPQVRERFYREARIATRIRHANVLEVIDLGELDDGRRYRVMELLSGDQWVREWQRASPAGGTG